MSDAFRNLVGEIPAIVAGSAGRQYEIEAVYRFFRLGLRARLTFDAHRRGFLLEGLGRLLDPKMLGPPVAIVSVVIRREGHQYLLALAGDSRPVECSPYVSHPLERDAIFHPQRRGGPLVVPMFDDVPDLGGREDARLGLYDSPVILIGHSFLCAMYIDA